MNLFTNLINNYIFVKSDFIGVSVSVSGMLHNFLNLIITILLFIVFYLVGKNISLFLFKSQREYRLFINIGLGYIAIASGIGILGLFSLLNPYIITLYLILVILVAVYSLRHVKPFYLLIYASEGLKKMWILRKDLLIWGVVLFISISFLRIFTPEIVEDGYHTDLPALYLQWGTTIHESKELLRVIPYPQLPEMIYLIVIFLGDKEMARFVHFGFYLFTIILMVYIGFEKKNPFLRFAPVLLVTAPLVVRYSPSQYTDFFAGYCFILAMLLISKQKSMVSGVLAGVFFGAVLSTKIWMLVYAPVFVFYILLINKKPVDSFVIKKINIFLLSSFCIVSIWYIRAFLITGNPFFPLFSRWTTLGETEGVRGSIASYIGINWKMFSYENMVVYSPLFFLGIIILLINIKKVFLIAKRFSPFIFLLLLMVEHLFFQIYLGRYLLSLYIVTTLFVSAGLWVMLKKNIYGRMVFSGVYVGLFLYYFLNTLLVLPYGLGWADKNKYLTRVLGRDNASYYDFDRKFNKWITKDDLVATDGIVSFYYADFAYIDINYVFSEEKKSFDELKKNRVTKLLIKGGDIKWFCKKLSLTDCDEKKVELLASYPSDVKKYNFYTLKD